MRVGTLSYPFLVSQPVKNNLTWQSTCFPIYDSLYPIRTASRVSGKVHFTIQTSLIGLLRAQDLEAMRRYDGAASSCLHYDKIHLVSAQTTQINFRGMKKRAPQSDMVQLHHTTCEYIKALI